MKLEIGYNYSFEIRREKCVINSPNDFSVLFLSDLHFNRFSQSNSKRIAATINELNPTLVLLGGDYVDSRRGLIHLNNFLATICQRQNIFAIAGNHDYYFGVDKIKKILLNNKVIWLENKSFNLNFKNTKFKIDGNLISEDNGDNDFSILLLHKPLHINQFKYNYNLVFAGHLHGGQFVFWKTHNKLYPGKFFYKWNILKAEFNNCKYFISKGLGDTLPIRYNCQRDLLFVQISGNN